MDKVHFRPHPKFRSKVVSNLHLNLYTYLFFHKATSSQGWRKLHLLDVHWVVILPAQNKPFRVYTQLLFPMQNAWMDTQLWFRLSKWITGCISLTLQWSECVLKIDSTHCQGICSLAAFVGHVPILDIWRAVMSNFVNTFISHCALTTASRGDTMVGKAVLKAFWWANETLTQHILIKSFTVTYNVVDITKDLKKKKSLLVSLLMHCICPLHDLLSFPNALESTFRFQCKETEGRGMATTPFIPLIQSTKREGDRATATDTAREYSVDSWDGHTPAVY